MHYRLTRYEGHFLYCFWLRLEQLHICQESDDHQNSKQYLQEHYFSY